MILWSCISLIHFVTTLSLLLCWGTDIYTPMSCLSAYNHFLCANLHSLVSYTCIIFSPHVKHIHLSLLNHTVLISAKFCTVCKFCYIFTWLSLRLAVPPNWLISETAFFFDWFHQDNLSRGMMYENQSNIDAECWSRSGVATEQM